MLPLMATTAANCNDSYIFQCWCIVLLKCSGLFFQDVPHLSNKCMEYLVVFLGWDFMSWNFFFCSAMVLNLGHLHDCHFASFLLFNHKH